MRYFILFYLTLSACNMPNDVHDNETAAWQELENVLRHQQNFVKVHAAEFLIKLGKSQTVKPVYLEELRLHGDEKPYRIGIWRVLAMADTVNRHTWVESISAVFGDSSAPDRLHALETMAKLGQNPETRWPSEFQEALHSPNASMQLYANWANAAPYTYFAEKLLSDSNLLVRKISAYVLRTQPKIDEAIWNQIAHTALNETTSSTSNCLALTALATAPGNSRNNTTYARIYTRVIKDWTTWPIADRIDLAASLANYGSENELPILTSMLHNEHAAGIYDTTSPQAADLRAAAAYSLLSITQKKSVYGNEKK